MIKYLLLIFKQEINMSFVRQVSSIDNINLKERPLSSESLCSELGKKIKWIHGTNSSILPLLPATNYTMLPSGHLLDRQIAPMSGEIVCGGMRRQGINQRLICGNHPVWGFDESWDYATKISHSFNPKIDMDETFKKCLNCLPSPESDEWDPVLIQLLRLKQWDPERFEVLCLENREIIERKKKDVLEQGPSGRILKAIDYPIEELQKAKDDSQVRDRIDALFHIKDLYDFFDKHKHWALECSGLDVIIPIFPDSGIVEAASLHWARIIHTVFRLRLYGDMGLADLRKQAHHSKVYLKKHPEAKILFAKDKQKRFLSPEVIIEKLIREKIELRIQSFAPRFQRMLKILDYKRSPVQLTKTDRDQLAHPFPMLLASTQLKENNQKEAYPSEVSQARFGKDIDLIFVPSEHTTETEDWLKSNNLETQVAVYPVALYERVRSIAREAQKVKPIWKKFICCSC